MANKYFWLIVALLPLCAQAQQSNYLDEMAKIDAQIAFIQKQNDLKAALLRSSTNEGMPRILSIMVDEKGATAQVLYSSGIVRWVKRGDVLLDGMSVQAIGKSSVLVGGTGGRFSLSFAAPQTGGAAGTQATGMMPPLPRVNIPMPLPPAATPPVASPATNAAAASVSAGK